MSSGRRHTRLWRGSAVASGGAGLCVAVLHGVYSPWVPAPRCGGRLRLDVQRALFLIVTRVSASPLPGRGD